MSSMIPEVLREASIETVPAVKILSDPSLVLHLDLKTCHVQETEFFTAFKLTMTRTDMLTALVGSFDVTFHLDHTVVLPTSPYDPPTHWKQTVFYLPQPISVQKGKLLLILLLFKRSLLVNVIHSIVIRWRRSSSGVQHRSAAAREIRTRSASDADHRWREAQIHSKLNVVFRFKTTLSVC